MDNQYNWKNILKQFLSDVSQLESSGGKDVEHPIIQDPRSLQYGKKAIGKYGLMPQTVREYIGREFKKGKVTPELSDLYKMKDKDLTENLKQNEDLQEKFAEMIAKKLYLDEDNNEEKMHYKWNMGTNIPSKKITPEMLDESIHVKKFRKLKGLIDGK